MVSVGVDIHKASGFAVVKDDDGRVVASFTFKNDRLGISDFVGRLQAFKDVRVAVESSGNFWVLGLSCLILLGLRLLPRLRLDRIG
ncbi:MAG: IS110 family transposase [Candidatus Norongarragalinales archaeon]